MRIYKILELYLKTIQILCVQIIIFSEKHGCEETIITLS
jgi:hypothetical protein